MNSIAPIVTPCVRICAVNPKSGFCEGCFRTLKEIAGWGRLTPEQREKVMAALPGRRAAVEVAAQ